MPRIKADNHGLMGVTQVVIICLYPSVPVSSVCEGCDSRIYGFLSFLL